MKATKDDLSKLTVLLLDKEAVSMGSSGATGFFGGTADNDNEDEEDCSLLNVNLPYPDQVMLRRTQVRDERPTC